jgi:hypothetical protein
VVILPFHSDLIIKGGGKFIAVEFCQGIQIMTIYRFRTTSVLASLLLTLFICASANAGTVLVDGEDTTGDGGGCGSVANPCNTIQAGVDNASPGDTVEIAKGVYLEEVTIPTGKDGLTLEGESKTNKSKKAQTVLKVTIDPEFRDPPANCEGDVRAVPQI